MAQWNDASMLNSNRYKYRVSLTHIKNNIETTVDSASIKSIIINREYYSLNMPIIIMILNLNATQYQQFVLSRFTSYVILHIERYDVNSNSSINKDIIKTKFHYFLPDNNPNYMKDIDQNVTTDDNAYKKLTIGLMSIDLININRSIFNANYKKINMRTLIQLGMEKIPKIILEPIKNNKLFESVYIPPIDSVSEYIDYLNSISSFYEGNYFFFMDFDYSYLMSNNGNSIDIKDGTFPTISIDIQNTGADESKLMGMILDNEHKVYKIYVDSLNTSLLLDEKSDYMVNSYLATTTNGKLFTKDIRSINNQYTKKMVFDRIKEENIFGMSYIEHGGDIILGISKPELDSSVLLPNKEWIIDHFEDNTEYNGKYYLLYKKDILVQQDGEFSNITNIGLHKVLK